MTLTSDIRKAVSMEIEGNYKASYDYDFNTSSWFVKLAPTVRFSDRLKIVFDFNIGKDFNEPGFVEKYKKVEEG